MNMQKWQQDSEYMSHVSDLLEREEVQKLDEYIQHVYSTRLEHSISVSYYSFCIARKYGMDAKATARAGLLHDLFYHDWRVTKFAEGTHAYMHPRIACANAEKLTVLSELEKDIIIKHMWLATIALPKYKESFVVTFVDKYCACEEVIVPLKQKTAKFFRSRWESIKFSFKPDQVI